MSSRDMGPGGLGHKKKWGCNHMFTTTTTFHIYASASNGQSKQQNITLNLQQCVKCLPSVYPRVTPAAAHFACCFDILCGDDCCVLLLLRVVALLKHKPEAAHHASRITHAISCIPSHSPWAVITIKFRRAPLAADSLGITGCGCQQLQSSSSVRCVPAVSVRQRPLCDKARQNKCSARATNSTGSALQQQAQQQPASSDRPFSRKNCNKRRE